MQKIILPDTGEEINLEDLKEFDNHKLVKVLDDKETGLRGFIAIHNTNLGHAVGGTRYFSYSNSRDALKDALNLSKAMSYKCALAGVPYGGGKGVIIKDKDGQISEKLLKAYTDKLNELNGEFFTGEDVGLTEREIKVLSENSKFIIGRTEFGGMPAPWAALSVFVSIKAAFFFKDKVDNLRGKSVAIKGLGGVGMELCRLLDNEGVKIFVSDVNNEREIMAKESFPGITIVPSEQIHKQEVDLYAPCAMGYEFTDNTVGELNCKIICGAANNQLDSPKIGTILHNSGILYIPDYVTNAGGLISVVDELDSSGYNKERVTEKIGGIRDTVLDILKRSTDENRPTSEIADEIAKTRIFK